MLKKLQLKQHPMQMPDQPGKTVWRTFYTHALAPEGTVFCLTETLSKTTKGYQIEFLISRCNDEQCSTSQGFFSLVMTNEHDVTWLSLIGIESREDYNYYNEIHAIPSLAFSDFVRPGKDVFNLAECMELIGDKDHARPHVEVFLSKLPKTSSVLSGDSIEHIKKASQMHEHAEKEAAKEHIKQELAKLIAEFHDVSVASMS